MMVTGTILAFLTTWHIVALLVIVLLLFGGKKLPELARGLGRGMRIFRDEVHGLKKEFDEPTETPPSADAGKPAATEKK